MIFQHDIRLERLRLIKTLISLFNIYFVQVTCLLNLHEMLSKERKLKCVSLVASTKAQTLLISYIDTTLVYVNTKISYYKDH